MSVDLPESIFRRVEAKAAELGMPVEQYVAEALEAKLGPAAGEKPWMAYAGQLAHLRDDLREIDRIVEEEFETIEPEE